MRMFLERLRPYAPLSLRLIVGAIFMLLGSKLVLHGGIVALRDQVTAWHLPAFLKPQYVALAIGWGALVGGALVALGFLTRAAGFVLAAIVVLTVVKTKMSAPFVGGLDMPLLQLAAAVSIVLSGAGRLSLDRRFFGGA